MNISMTALRGRVLVSWERVKFADADPYGHLASGAYVDMLMNHRVEALDDLIGFSIVQYARAGIAFPARAIEVSCLRPAFVGDHLEIGSWIDSLGGSSFEVRALVTEVEDRVARAALRTRFATVDSRSGKSMPVPESLPSSAMLDPLPTLQPVTEYLQTIEGVPEGWAPETADLQAVGRE